MKKLACRTGLWYDNKVKICAGKCGGRKSLEEKHETDSTFGASGL